MVTPFIKAVLFSILGYAITYVIFLVALIVPMIRYTIGTGVIYRPFYIATLLDCELAAHIVCVLGLDASDDAVILMQLASTAERGWLHESW